MEKNEFIGILDVAMVGTIGTIETFSIEFISANRRPQFAVRRLPFEVQTLWTFSKTFFLLNHEKEVMGSIASHKLTFSRIPCLLLRTSLVVCPGGGAASGK